MTKCTDKLNTIEGIDYIKSLVTFDGINIRLKKDNSIVPEYNKNGAYLSCPIEGRRYQKHRIIYALTYGIIKEHIDHIDGNKKNNSPTNLRQCCQSLNTANSKVRKDNTSGYIGVIWHKAANKWQAQTMFKGKRIHIGLYTDKDEAALAYNMKLRELFGPKCTFNKVFEDVTEEMLTGGQ